MSSPTVILGVGGGIAAYKSCDLLRRLQELSYDVTVIPTPASLNFVGKATWEALSGKKVTTEVWEDVESVRHVALGASGSPILIAPATADLMARLAAGRADDLLTNTVLASTAPIFLAPAKHPQMWLNPATVANVATLRSRGYFVLEPATGRLTGEDSGIGRLPDTASILHAFTEFLGGKKDFHGRRVLVSAGGTREPIDAVRYIGNRSSGKQGYALAKIAAMRGAQVDLVLANAEFPAFPGITIHRVETVDEMRTELKKYAAAVDVIAMAAAVSDARPENASHHKLHKEELRSISLTLNPDIVTELSASRPQGQVILAFAAETDDHLTSAQEKMERKGVDLLYVNDVSGGAIFGSDTSYGTILLRDGARISVGESSKEGVAGILLDAVRDKLG